MIEPKIIEIETFGKNNLGKDITGGYTCFKFQHSGIFFNISFDKLKAYNDQSGGRGVLDCLEININREDFLENISKNKFALSEIYNWFLKSKIVLDIKNITTWNYYMGYPTYYYRNPGYFEPFGTEESDSDFIDYLIYLKYDCDNCKEIFNDGKKRSVGIHKKTYCFLFSLIDNQFLTSQQNDALKNFLNLPEIHPDYIEKLKSDIPQPGNIYLIYCQNYYKIGKSKNYNFRKKHFDTIMPLDTELIHSFRTNDMNYAEKYLHNKYQHLHHKGEWFNLTQKEINEICSISDFQL